MKTSKEILLSVLSKGQSERKIKFLKIVSYEKEMEAMEIKAKENAIEFQKWIDENINSLKLKRMSIGWAYGLVNHRIMHEELYSIFLYESCKHENYHQKRGSAFCCNCHKEIKI